MWQGWQPKEILTVLTRYPGEGPRLLTLEIGRSEDAISSMARRYGLRTARRCYRRRRHAEEPKSIVKFV